MSQTYIDQVMGYGTPKLRDSLVFFLLASGPPRFRSRDPSASLHGLIDLVVLLHIGVWVLGALWIGFRLYPSLVRRGQILRVGPPQIAGLLLVGALAASITFSPGRLLTTFVVGQTAVMLVFTWLFVRLYGVRSCLHHLFWSIVVLAVMIFVARIVAPDLVVSGITGRLRGDLIAPSGQIATIGLVLALCAMPALEPKRLILIGGGLLVLLWLSQTRAALIAFAAFVALGGLFGRGLPVKKVLPLLFVGVLLLGAQGMFSTVRNYLVRDEASLTTLSDRIPLWKHMAEVTLRESPYVGLGFYAASRVVAPEHNRGLGTAHSAFLEVFTGAGILGAGLFIILLAMMVYSAALLLSRGQGDGPILAVCGLLSVLLLMAITGSDPVQAGPVGFALWIVAAALPALRDERRAGDLIRTGYIRSPNLWTGRVVTSAAPHPSQF
jgi:hypothetical protein